MEPVAATVGYAVVMFAGSNIDDAIVLTVLNISAEATGAPRRWQIWAGQYLGIGLIVALSVLAALGLSTVPLRWTGLLGLLPLALGGWLLVKAIRERRNGQSAATPVVTGVWAVAVITIANSGDNISIYTPAFRILGPGGTALAVGVFAVGTAAWCLAASALARHQPFVPLLRRYGRWIIPAVFLGQGVYILYRTGLLGQVL
jgi:cadmium resistance protein CadD (predicted permease)